VRTVASGSVGNAQGGVIRRVLKCQISQLAAWDERLTLRGWPKSWVWYFKT